MPRVAMLPDPHRGLGPGLGRARLADSSRPLVESPGGEHGYVAILLEQGKRACRKAPVLRWVRPGSFANQQGVTLNAAFSI